MKKIYSLIILILSIGLSNCNDSEITSSTDFASDEISFKNSKTDLSEVSNSFGIQSLTNATVLNSGVFKFAILASPSFVNGQKIDLNNAEVVLTKRGARKYDIASNILDIGEIRMSINTESKQLAIQINNEIVKFDQLSAKHHLAIVLMTGLFNEATLKGTDQKNKINESGRTEKAYYGYTVGWGLTAEESTDHEASVRAGAAGSVSQYGCTYLGTSTSCIFGSIGCTTISTYRCTGGDSSGL